MIHFISALAIVILCVVDQVIKWVIQLRLKPIGNVVVIPKIIELSYTENTGASFGIFGNSTFALSVFTSVMLVVCFVVLL